MCVYGGYKETRVVVVVVETTNNLRMRTKNTRRPATLQGININKIDEKVPRGCRAVCR